MHKNQIETDITDKQVIAYVLTVLYKVSSQTEKILEILDRLSADTENVDTTKP